MESSKGSLTVIVKPLPTRITLKRGGEIISTTDAPMDSTRLPVGNYTLTFRHREAEEMAYAEIRKNQETSVDMELDFGTVTLTAQPPDADYEFVGNNDRRWRGSLPATINDVPSGVYFWKVTRKGWTQRKEILVKRGEHLQKQAVFEYGTLALDSQPTGLEVSTNGSPAGRTPLTLTEVPPGVYRISASDGDYKSATNLTVTRNGRAEHLFVFRYGIVNITSSPSGAMVSCQGKDIGTTPLNLERFPLGHWGFDLRLEGYVSSNCTMQVSEGKISTVKVKLFSKQYLDAMRSARKHLETRNFSECHLALDTALRLEPGDATADALQWQLTVEEKKAEQAQQDKANAAAGRIIVETIGKIIRAK